MKLKRKQRNVIVTTALSLLAVVTFYPTAKILIERSRTPVDTVHAEAQIYPYSMPSDLVVESTVGMHPAEAVPILVYHGVIVAGNMGVNTSRAQFIAQMEMLKRKGYQTISVAEYDSFRQGNFVLPPKPIIITFDDGRKDSFFTVDGVLAALGFKATLFVATARANVNDPFYLSWNELKQVQATGRWEIEAHGRNSHDEVVVNAAGDTGTYLAARMYTKENGLETEAQYQARVEQDYMNGIADLKNSLGIEARYFAVPLNNFGVTDPSSFPGAVEFNQVLTKRYFRLAFVQAQQPNGTASESFYNYADANPGQVKRLSVSDIGADTLLAELERFAPKPPVLTFPDPTGADTIMNNLVLLRGTLDTTHGLTLMSSTSTPLARFVIGDTKWKNYAFEVSLRRQGGRSVSLIVYYTDDNNFISLSWGEQSLILLERVNGKETELASYYPWTKEGEVEVLLGVSRGVIKAQFSGTLLTSKIHTQLQGGAVGFDVWDPAGATSSIKTFKVINWE